MPFLGLNQASNQGSPGQQQMAQNIQMNQANLARIQQQRMMQQAGAQGAIPPNVSTQFVAELDKTPFPPSFPDANWKVPGSGQR